MPRNSPEDSPTYRYTERERKREKEKEKALIDGEKTENQQRRRNHSTFVSLRYTLYINKNSDEVHGLLWMMFTFLRVFPFFFFLFYHSAFWAFYKIFVFLFLCSFSC